MKFCSKCKTEWGDEVRICNYVTDKSRKICGTRLN